MGELKTQRLTLAPFVDGHVESMHALSVDPEVRRYLFKDQIIPRTEVEAMVASSKTSFADIGCGFYALFISEQGNPAEGEFAGFCGVRAFENGNDIELLLGINPAIWGRGLGMEAAREVLRHCFEECALEKVVAAADTPNQRSIRVLQKLGMSFRERREWHGWDTMFYEITAQEFGL